MSRSQFQEHREQIGEVIWINGPVIRVRGSRQVQMLEVVEIGDEHLVGEVIGLEGDLITLQVYEETSGLRPGAPAFGTGMPLSVELGPGLLTSIFDGIQRPLPILEKRSGAFIGRGIKTTPLYHEKMWAFTPRVHAGDTVRAGTVLGVVPETHVVEHRVLLPPQYSGTVRWVAPQGEYTLTDPIVRLTTSDGREVEIPMLQRWPVRRPRPYLERLVANELLVTGQRVLDTFFPLAKGGTAAIPGGFGAGKTITQHQIAKWSDADIIIYVGCGERGNEMTEVLQEFPQLEDPRTHQPLMERTILIANTSNMPVAAREASIYTGVTLAEYYRDMGYNVALMADSTSRWAEALREIAGRLEEMPAEEGYPAYLASRLAEFYERAGRVQTLSGEPGSISIIGAVSPPGGDFSEPVTQHTKRFIRCFWALDKELASARHFPSINWLNSYSEYVEDVRNWWQHEGNSDWHELRKHALNLLQREDELQQIVQLVGPDALPDDQRLVLETARLLREGYLQQNAMSAIDSYASVKKQIRMLRAILHFYDRALNVVNMGCPIKVLHELPVTNRLIRMKSTIANDSLEEIDQVDKEIDQQMDRTENDYQDGAQAAQRAGA